MCGLELVAALCPLSKHTPWFPLQLALLNRRDGYRPGQLVGGLTADFPSGLLQGEQPDPPPRTFWGPSQGEALPWEQVEQSPSAPFWEELCFSPLLIPAPSAEAPYAFL